jgi:hypothetical protein
MDRGASFRRSRPFDLEETASVISVGSDLQGVPHVRFNVKIAGPHVVLEEQRTLSLESFRNLYRERVAI